MTDDDKELCERLRAYRAFDSYGISQPRNPDGPDAAARIEALSARIAELEAQTVHLRQVDVGRGFPKPSDTAGSWVPLGITEKP